MLPSVDVLLWAASAPSVELIACGDSMNDTTMVSFAGLGVAMENAVDECKAAAKLIAPPSWEDGVAQVIERFLNEGEFTKE